MKTLTTLGFVCVAGAIACPGPGRAWAQSITNGGFESGLAGWTTADQAGSDGTFWLQTGAASPVNAFAVPAPPGGVHAAMTDSVAGGSHVLYQDFAVPAVVAPGTTLAFALYLNNGAGTYTNPGNLDWAATNASGVLNLNQQARIDITSAAAGAFSVSAGDVLLNLYQTGVATPPVTGYDPFQFDLTALLQAHAGETLRLRFAETDNVNFFNMGVDRVRFFVPASPAWLLVCGGMAGALRRRRA